MIETKSRKTAQQLGTEFSQRATRIVADDRLTERHRKAMLAREYLTTKQQLAALRREHDAEVAAQRLALERSAFGMADTTALRTALDGAAARITTRDEAASALRRAERTGDNIAAHAVFVVATEQGFRDVADAYLASRPGTAGALSRLQEHDQAAADTNERLFSPFVPLRPAGLRAVNDAYLEQMAALAGDVPTPAPVDNFPGMFP